MAALMTTKSRGNVLLGLGLLLLSQGVLGFGGAPTVARRSAMSASALRMVIDKDEITALNDIVIIQADTEARKTTGGLFLPTTADIIGDRIDPNYRVGTVVAVGPGRVREDGSLIPMPYKKGQRVIMPGASSIGVQLDILLGSRGLYAFRWNEIVAEHPE